MIKLIKSSVKNYRILAVLLFFNCSIGFSQTPTGRLELSEVLAKFDSRAYLFSIDNGNLQSGFEYPKGTNNSTIFASSFWLTAIDSATGNLHTSAKTYPNSFDGLFAGPIRNSPYSDVSRNGIFKVNKNTVIDFNQNFGSAGYIIPTSIINWPGNGNINSGISKKLAPFYDLNNNGTYDPITNGEYPLTLGEENLYFIYNDLTGNRTGINTNVPALNVDIRSYVYALENEYDIFKNCIFLNITLKNRSQNTYNDLYFGLWYDFDIGGSSDDHIGCDSSLNLFYAYNGDDSDVDYGTDIPAQGVMLLNQNLNSFIAYNNSSHPINGDPQSVIDVNNYLRGLWRNGNRISKTGNGMDTATNVYTKFLFNHGINQETGPGNDKRALGSIGPFRLSPEESTCFDLVVFPANDPFSNIAFTSVTQLLNKADTIKKLFDIVGLGCSSPIINSIEEALNQPENTDVSVFPNPAKHLLNIQSKESHKNWSLKLLSAASSQIVHATSGKNTIKQSIKLEGLNRGLYILQIQTDSSIKNFKVLLYE